MPAVDASKACVVVHMDRELYEELDDIRWTEREPSMVALVRKFLKQGAEKYREGRERQAEAVS